jgi:NADH-quinone oxidoreductase subunit J
MNVLFYLAALLAVFSTLMVITRAKAVHALLYLVVSLLALALVFYVLGAPFIAALEVIIYAGAIMVLFLFIVMMLEVRASEEPIGAYLLRWLPAAVLGALSLAAAFVLIMFKSGRSLPLPLAAASPLEFGRFLFQKYWFSVEIVSFLLFVALVGALYLGKREV